MITGAMRTASSIKDYFKNHKGHKGEDLHENTQKESREKNNEEKAGKGNYFKGARGQWQGKLAEERFPSGQFKYNDFVKVVDENDRFRTFDLKFTTSNNVPAGVKNKAGFKDAMKGSISKVAGQIQADMKIKFKKEKKSKNLDIKIQKTKDGEFLAKIESHNVIKKNAPEIEELLSNPKYRSMFRGEMVKELAKIGARTNEAGFDLQSYTKECRVSGEFLCQAPKSVSVTMMYPEHFEKILRCHEKANEAAMKFVEENYIVSRVQVSGISRRELTKNMLSAGFTELSNRDRQPHLHTHNNIFNTTRNPFYNKNRKGGREFLTIDYRAIRNNFPIIDGVYKNKLSEGLKKEGYELKYEKDNRLNFEIAGYTRDQILHFSRVPKIDKKLEEMGTNREQATAKQRNVANLKTRKAKVHVDEELWKTQVLKEMAERGIQSPRLIHERAASPSIDIPAADLKKELLKASDDFFYGHAAFTKHEFVKGVLKLAGDILPVEYIEDYFDRSGRFITLGVRKGKTYFSTAENIKIEQSVYRYAAAGKNKRPRVIRESKVNRFLKYTNLKEGQKKAVRFMATCPHRVAAIQGDPGVGKSYMLDKARVFFEKEGYKVTGLAPSNQAALTLREKSGLWASTIHSFFIRLQVEAGTWDKDRNPLDLRLTDFKGLRRRGQKKIWFVDEASLIDNYTMYRLLEAAELKNAYVVFLGDKGQMPPVESGKPFANMINDEKIPFVEVKEILRQKEVWLVFDSGKLSAGNRNRILDKARRDNATVTFFDSSPFASIDPRQLESVQVKRGLKVTVFKDRSIKEAVQSAVDGQVLDSLDLLRGRIHEIKNREVRLREIAKYFAGLSPGERAQTAIITATNRDRTAINNYVREALKEQGELTNGLVFHIPDSNGEIQGKEFAVGDKVILLEKKEFSGHWVLKNDTGIIKKFGKKTALGVGKSGFYLEKQPLITIETRGKRIVVNLKKYDRIDYGNCSTTYKEQSAGHKRVLAHFDTKQYNVNNLNDFRVKISRAEGEIIIWTDDGKRLYDAVKNEHARVSINDFSVDDFKVHETPTFADKEEFLKEIAEKFEYENAAFSKGEFIKGAAAIYEEMAELEEAPFFITETDIKEHLRQETEAGHYIEVGEKNRVLYFSTRENIRIEQEIYERTVAAKNRVSGFDQAAVRQYLEKSTLSSSQKEAFFFLTAGRDRVRALHCAPGAGEASLLKAAGKFYEEVGNYKVVGLAPSNRAVSTLKENAGFEKENAFTIHGYLIQLQKEAGTWEADRDPTDLRLTDLSGLTPGSHKETWFVDKSSLLDNHVMNKLLLAAELKNAEVVLSGSRSQLQPVGAGCPFTNMIKDGKVGYVELDEIVGRGDKSSPVKDALQKVVDNDLPAGLEILESRIVQERDDEIRLQKIASTYTALPPEEREQTAVVTGTNRDRVKINDNVRDILKEKGELGSGFVVKVTDSRGKEQDREFSPGDRVIFLKKDDIGEHTVGKDETGVVKEIKIETGKSGVITIESNGNRIAADLSEYNSIEHAYCSTAYKEMSSPEKARTLAHIDTKQHNVNSLNDFVVKLSAAEVEVSLFTDDRKGLFDAVKREQDKTSINDFSPENYRKHEVSAQSEKEALLEKISGKFEYKNAAFSRDDFLNGTKVIYTDMIELGETALEISAADLENEFHKKIEDSYFIEIGRTGEAPYFSTNENIRIEQEIYERAAAAKNRVSGFDEAKVRDFAANTTLNSGQRDALFFMTSGRDRIKAVQGAPGVGKSFMLNIAGNFYEKEGYKVVALAPSNKAVLNLKERAGFADAATIHSYLIKLQKEAGTWETGRDPLDLRLTNLEGLTPGLHPEIWFVDEASLIDNYTMNRLLEAAEKKNAEVIPIGDKNQLQPVGGGKPFTNMLKGEKLKYVEVNEILRQEEEWTVYHAERLSETDRQEITRQAGLLKNNAALTYIKGSPPDNIADQKNPAVFQVEKYKAASGAEIEIHKDSALKEAVKDAVEHNIAGSLNKLNSRITEIADNAERLETAADRYATLSPEKRDSAVIITATNKDRIAINDLVRDFLKHSGELGKGQDFGITDIEGKSKIREFSPGDKIIFLKKDDFKDHLISKDDVGVIKKIEGKNITVLTRGKEIVIPADKYNHIDHAYCRTTYRVQGADYDTVLAHINTYQKMVNSKNDFLVKISRSKHELEIFTDDRNGLYHAVKEAQYKISIADFVDRVYVRDASKIVDDRFVERVYNRDFDKIKPPWKTRGDLQRGDFHYVNYFKQVEAAGEHMRKAKAFSLDKEKSLSLFTKFEKAMEKAHEYKAKSEFFYQRAVEHHAKNISKQFEKSSIVQPGDGDSKQVKLNLTEIKQRFVEKYIPVGRLNTLEKIFSDVSPFIDMESKLFADEFSIESGSPGSEFYLSPEVGGAGPEQDVPGLDGSGEDGGIVPGVDGGEGRDGGASGPGISFGT